MKPLNGIASLALSLALALLAWGCGGTANPSAARFDATKGAHPADWMPTHYAEFVKNPDQCRSCHGSTTDPALAGGTSKVSCFTCHPGGPSHPTGWSAANQHGRLGAQLAPAQFAGFAYCTKCHGADYASPMVNTPSCKACHTKAPHPDKPWRGATVATPTHVMTDAGNVPQCYRCHANGANSTVVPVTPAPPGTAPGCFNNTMCHGTSL